MEVVSETSILAVTAAAHLQDDLSSESIFACHRTQINSPRDLLCLDGKCNSNKSTSRKLD